MNLLLYLGVLCCDELVQSTSELIFFVKIILRRLQKNNIFLGDVLIIFTMDHTKIIPFKYRPSLTSTHVLPCFRMVVLETSVRASGDENFHRYQAIAQYPYSKILGKPELVSEFLTLVLETFMFVDN